MPSRLTVVLMSLLLSTPAVILWLLLMIQPARVAIECPVECRCRKEGYFVYCKDSGLNSIPPILPTHVIILVLNGNSITYFENDSFVSRGLVELRIIKADFCKIGKIELGAFNGLTKLTNLSMRGNKISEIITGTFENSRHLKDLDLRNNRIEHLGSDIFYGLVELQYINLRGNKLQYLHPDTFVVLPKLTSLYLSENFGLQLPTDRHFINSHSLKKLDISRCNISSVSLETFANVSALKWLYLGYNNVRSLDISILKALPKLYELNLNDNEISEIIAGKLEEISFLENLDLGYNKIEHLESDVFQGLVNLKYINLKGNKLQYLHPDTFVGLPKLISLYLSENFGLQLPTDRHFINSHSLKQLDISRCNISSVSVQTFANVSALEWLDLRYNNVRSLDISILKALPKLSELKLNHNEISEVIPGTLEKFSRLEYLHLDYNKIEHLRSDVFCELVNLKYIHLEDNKLQYLHPDTFVGLPNLQGLYLANNADLQIPTDRHFINSHSLKLLGISGCNISSVSVETFANVSALDLLDLSENNLRIVDINILIVLKELSVLYLDDNPLQCDCQLQEVWRWCEDHNIQTAFWETAPECNTPSEVEGIWWGILEKGQCLQNNIHYFGNYKKARYSYISIEDRKTAKETEQEENIKKFVKQYELPISAVLFIFGTTGNVILIIIIICNKDMRNVPNMYILNLAVSDMIYLTVLFSEACANRFHYMFLHGNIMCTLHSFCYRMSVCLSAYSIAVISIHRYRVTVNPLNVRVSSKPTWRATVATIFGVWIVAALFAIPAARSRNLCREPMFLLLIKYYQLIFIFELLVSCALPLCVIAFCSVMTAHHLMKSSCSLTEGTQNPQLKIRKNAAKVLYGLTVVFLISYVPYHISETYFYVRINLEISLAQFFDEIGWMYNLYEIKPILILFLSLNSCLNPVALFCTSLAFRRQFKRYLTCCCKTNSPPTDFELRRRN